MLSMMINGAVAALSVVAWLMLVLGAGDPDHLAARGMESLKYFTVLSNLFSGVISFVYLVCHLMASVEASDLILALKLMAASAVLLTFFTVILLLGPKFGWGQMYKGGNLWMHLVLPLLAAIDCMLFVPVGSLPFVATFVALAPCFVYGAWYLWMVVRHGAEQNGKVYDFYGFLRWGKEKTPVVAVAMLTQSWVLGLMVWLGSRAFCHM
ncbi:MAG: hypothetical protein IKG22_14485 [Atopobiaceae bacterium]|nr:hypothetical protein [Atopobiaceae bacterium]